MCALRVSHRLLAKAAPTRPRSLPQSVQQHLTARAKDRGPSLPVIPQCPSPTCECADMPPDLDIDRSKNLDGTMAAYSDQIIISTGQADWKSKIEDEKNTAPWGSVVSEVKTMLGPKGRYHDPYRNTIVSTSSFEGPLGSSNGSSQALHFPSFSVVDDIDPSESSIAQFLESFIVSKPGSATSTASQTASRGANTSDNLSPRKMDTVRPISAPTILICSHNSRDSRCGILGPLLHAEFAQYINRRHTLRNRVTSDIVSPQAENGQGSKSFASHPVFRPDAVDPKHEGEQPINVGMISHIGGHKWAGNVIVYIPPDYQINPVEHAHRGAKPKDETTDGYAEPVVHEGEVLSARSNVPNLSPLAGKGIWYGRVEPKHVEGIVEQTIGHGQILRELFRGGIHRNGNQIRL